MDRVTKIILGSSGLALVALLAVPAVAPETREAPSEDLPIAGVLAAEAAAQHREVTAFSAAPADLLAQQRERASQLRFQRNPFEAPARPVAPEPEPQAPAPAPPKPPQLELTGISRFGADTRALLNGQLVAEGDVLPGSVRVVRIERTSITVLAQGREWTVSLGDSQ